MSKAIYFTLLTFLLLSACSSPDDNQTRIELTHSEKGVKVSVVEAIKAQGIALTDSDSPEETELVGTKGVSYKLDNDDNVSIYYFDTLEQREEAYKQHIERQMIMSSHAPIVYQTNLQLILYYSNTDSTTPTPKLAETTYGDKIQKAVQSVV